jgi:hypothetical protein
MRSVRCKSGIMGHQDCLRNGYRDYEEFAHYSDMYGLAGRLGFTTAFHAWKANPVVQWSVVPEDFGVAPRMREKRR